MITALLITGDTYTSRRDIKALGGTWNPDEGGWIVPASDAARQFAAAKGFHATEITVDPVLLERPTGERLRAMRQAKLDRCAARNLARAECLDALAAREAAKVTAFDDFAFWTQPILVGHHSEKAHRRLRGRLDAAMHNSVAYAREAEQLRAAAVPAKARIAGDAELAREEKRRELDRIITVGSRVLDFAFGAGTVVRVHKKSYTVKFDGGFQYARDKTYVRPL